MSPQVVGRCVHMTVPECLRRIASDRRFAHRHVATRVMAAEVEPRRAVHRPEADHQREGVHLRMRAGAGGRACGATAHGRLMLSKRAWRAAVAREHSEE